MNDSDLYSESDDSSIEIVDIDAPDSTEASKSSSAILTKRFPWSSLAPHFSLTQRRIQLVVTASIIALLLLVLVGSYAPMREEILKSIFSQSVPTNISARDLFYIRANPSWGQLTIDGKVIQHLPTFNKDAPLQLATGHHRLRWIAPPFVERRCIVSVPPRDTYDTCTIAAIEVGSQSATTWLLSFSGSMQFLPNQQRLALSGAIQDALNAVQSTEIVQPGERYAVAGVQHHYAIATLPLRATLRYQIDTNNEQTTFCIDSLLGMPNTTCRMNGEDCRLLCTTYLSPYASSRHEWITFGVVRTFWDYTTLSGKTVALNQPEIDEPAGVDEHVLPLGISWDGQHWHVTAHVPVLDVATPNISPVCFPAIDTFQLRDTMAPLLPGILSYSLQFIASNSDATGCLVDMTIQKPSDSATIATAYVLERFGVFLAVNSLAHQYWPAFPMANAYEQRVAQQLSIQNAQDTVRWAG